MDIKEAKIQDLEKELDTKKQQLKTDLDVFREKIAKTRIERAKKQTQGVLTEPSPNKGYEVNQK